MTIFDELRPHQKILVVGQQRSGTRFSAYCIAHELGIRFADEKEIGLHKADVARDLFSRPMPVVLQAPGITHVCERFADDVAVVFVRRNFGAVLQSQRRIHFDESWERVKYAKIGVVNEKLCMVQLKYEHWKNQKAEIAHAYELQYESLANHPLWVEKRSGWAWDRIR